MRAIFHLGFPAAAGANNTFSVSYMYVILLTGSISKNYTPYSRNMEFSVPETAICMPFYGIGKNLVNRVNTPGIVTMEKMKLPRMNWLVMELLPPSRSVTMGTPVIGGTALSRKIIRAK